MKALALATILATLLNIPTAFAGRVVVSGRISQESINRMITGIEALHRQGDRDIAIVITDSDGGELEEAFRGHAAIHLYGASTVTLGECASACTVIFAAGHERLASSSARFMFHPVRFVEPRFVENALTRAMDPRELERRRRPVRELYRRNRRQHEASFAAQWSNSIRAVAPELAQRLDRARTLTQGADVWVSAQQSRALGYATGGCDHRCR